MLGNFGQLMNLLRNAGQLKQSMQELAERMQTARYTGEAGGGQVRATVDGRGDLLSLKIDPALIESRDIELLEELTCAAVRDAVARSRQAAQQEVQQLTGGIGLPGLDGLFGGPPSPQP